MVSSEDREKLVALIKDHDKNNVIPNWALARHKQHCIATYGLRATRRWVRQAYKEIAHAKAGDMSVLR